jgi:hypothetical protein
MSSPEGHYPSWPLIARGLVGLAGFLIVVVFTYMGRQILINSDNNERQDKALIENKATLEAIRDYELRSLRFEIGNLSASIKENTAALNGYLQKLDERLRQQELRGR